MVNVKPLPEIAAKFVQRAQAASPAYESGIRTAPDTWQAHTVASESNYEQGVQAAIGQKRFSKGVTKAGTAKWQANAIAKGVPRYPTGVAAAQDSYSAGFAPYHGVLSRITLPARGPRGAPQNMNRATAVAQALYRQRTGQSAPSGVGA